MIIIFSDELNISYQHDYYETSWTADQTHDEEGIMASSTIIEGRRNRILRILTERGEASVDELCREMSVSAVTIRRDLDSLDRSGALIRRHGGAQLGDGISSTVPEVRLEEKDVLNIDEKNRIARQAVQMVGEGEIVFVNSGSTTLAFLHALRSTHVKVVTNNAAAVLTPVDSGVELILTGGEYRRQSRSLVGEFAIKTIREIYSGITFLGTNGLSLEHGLMTTVYQECGINQAMINNTHNKVVVLADYSKMGRVSNFMSSPIDAVDIIITDDKCPPELRRSFEKAGIEVIISK
jgi:DeoR/GlpR family transcriptional regulator of sugar metabolism